MSGPCTWDPPTGTHLAGDCKGCGHAVVVHIGVDHCPICELVDLAAQYRAVIEPAPVQEPPKPGDRLHIWGPRYGWLAGTVEGPMAFSLGYFIRVDPESLPLNPLAATPHDESRTAIASWHWPCDGDGDVEQSAEPEPATPTSITVNVHVAGSVLAERDLENRIATQLGRIAAQRGIRY